jgi:hypothetical protein
MGRKLNKLKCAAIQMDCAPAPVPERLSRAADLVAEAADGGAELDFGQRSPRRRERPLPPGLHVAGLLPPHTRHIPPRYGCDLARSGL